MDSSPLAPRQSGAAAIALLQHPVEQPRGYAPQDSQGMGSLQVDNKGTSVDSETGRSFIEQGNNESAESNPTPDATLANGELSATPDAGTSGRASLYTHVDAEDNGEDDDDWLLDSDEEGHVAVGSTSPNFTPVLPLPLSMEQRDWQRVHARFHDVSERGPSLPLPSCTTQRLHRSPVPSPQQQGYKEGITSGKLSTLQSGFDVGFGGAGGGAELGRRVGKLRGAVGAMLGVLAVGSAQSRGALKRKPKGRRMMGRGGARSGMAGDGAVDLHVGQEQTENEGEYEELSRRLGQLHVELATLDVEGVAEPDWEALEHARTHGAEEDGDTGAGGAGHALFSALDRPEEREMMTLARQRKMKDLEERVETLRDDVMRSVGSTS